MQPSTGFDGKKIAAGAQGENFTPKKLRPPPPDSFVLRFCDTVRAEGAIKFERWNDKEGFQRTGLAIIASRWPARPSH